MEISQGLSEKSYNADINNDEDSNEEALMIISETRTSIKKIYGMLWDVLALYEKTEMYNRLPEDEKKTEIDIWNFMGDKLLAVRKETETAFLGNEKLRSKMEQVIDETEHFVRSYEVPGVVKRWKRMNPKIIYFDCVFDLMEECPENYKEISRGLTDMKFACYPDAELIENRRKYFAEINQKNEESNLKYSETRIFQNELLNTLTLVFQNDFKEYL